MNIFFIGMKVVCVDDADPSKPFPYHVPNRPVRDRIYTVREVMINRAGEIGILLHELKNASVGGAGRNQSETAFHAWRFRPVSQSKLTKSRFKALGISELV